MEQIKGGVAYPASDLYSLGVTCFHLLAGIHPSDLWTEQGYGWVMNWRQYLKKPISQELGQVLDKLLQKDIQQRYQSAAQVLQDLNQKPQPPLFLTQPPILPKLGGFMPSLLARMVRSWLVAVRTRTSRFGECQNRSRAVSLIGGERQSITCDISSRKRRFEAEDPSIKAF